jgi:hypothetical protein
MPRPSTRRALLSLLLPLASGCASAAGPGEVPAPPPAPPAVPAPRAPVGPVTLESVVATVRADAAQRLGLAASKIVVESAEAVIWSDGSLGCAQPDQVYTQALVPGYQVRLRAGGRRLDYHASQRGFFVLCPDDLAVDPLPAGVTR